MDGPLLNKDFGALVDDREAEGIFRVDRSVYTDPEVFELEMARIFEGGWVYLCHESQIPEEGSYYSTEIGNTPVVVIRQKDGEICSFINACSHRAALLTPRKQGKARVLTCRFHGWAYSCDGRCVRIKQEEEGYGGSEFDKSKYNLRRLPLTQSYRGFIFGSLEEGVPPLMKSLAGAAGWIDLMIDQSPEGLEVVPGSSTYTIHGNWKMQIENSVDGHHVSTVHRVFASTMRNREERDGLTGLAKTEGGRITGKVPSGAYDLGNGHMSIWAQHTTPERRPIYKRKEWLQANLPPGKVEWILNRGRNLTVFPNVALMDNPSTQIRRVRPISPDRTEVTVYCIGHVGEDAEARAARLRKFEDFYLTSGMATSDDMAALEDTFVGSHARSARWNDFNRGLHSMISGPDNLALSGGFEAITSSDSWENENLYLGFYRRWRDLMTTGGKG
jgi:benzoate/toluate 1,2-dioxygenase alpha subunit